MVMRLLTSSVGLKVVMALSGLVMVGFLVGHMAGNLLVFLGPRALNDYAASLHSMPLVLWGVRMGLLVALVAHVSTAIMLSRKNRHCRGDQGYKVKASQSYSQASRNMALTGSLVLVYVIYHLAHFTWKWTGPSEIYNSSHSGVDVYGMVVASFQNIGIAVVYILAMVLLGLHLLHGICSAWDSLGLNHPQYTPWMRRFAQGLSIVLVLGFSSVPLAVLMGLVG
ncbi:MAG: succinate dehydrogenase cytochrome b subunit [Proteobacteria bacterium]|nr:succinate dehydrogenase cytochrome b subunit [Pseudomonadota bacterium]